MVVNVTGFWIQDGSYWCLDGADQIFVSVHVYFTVGQTHQHSLETSCGKVHQRHGGNGGWQISSPQLFPLQEISWWLEWSFLEALLLAWQDSIIIPFECNHAVSHEYILQLHSSPSSPVPLGERTAQCSTWASGNPFNTKKLWKICLF